MKTDVSWPLPLAALLIFASATVFVREAWAAQAFQAGVFLLLAATTLAASADARAAPLRLGPCLVWCIPLWGLLQILFRVTNSTADTREATLRWGALAAVFFLARLIGRNRLDRQIFLGVFAGFATVLGTLCLTQVFTSQGRVLWFFETGYDDYVYGTFPYYNNYAQFVELAIPVLLWRALSDPQRAWGYTVAVGALYASVIGATSRAGTVLCTLELLVVPAMAVVRLRGPDSGVSSRSAARVLAAVPLLALVFTLVVGWERVWSRFAQDDPFLGRREYLQSAVRMTADRPVAGFGLGTFTAVYQRYAVRDFPCYANHAHNDWAEMASEGGLVFLALVAIPFLAAVPMAVRHPWGLGLIAVMLHACVDYPFPRAAVSGWLFALAGLLYGVEDA
jgi:hypothetical protein